MRRHSHPNEAQLREDSRKHTEHVIRDIFQQPLDPVVVERVTEELVNVILAVYPPKRRKRKGEVA